MPDAFPHTFSADPPYDTQAPKIRFQFRRDQRPAPTGPRKSCIPATGGRRHLLHVYAHICTYGHGHTFKGTRTHAHTMVTPARPRHPATSPTRPASGLSESSANPIHSNALNLRHISADQAPTQPTQIPWGAWVWRRLATAASTATTTLRRCDASTPGAQHLCYSPA